MSAVADLIEDAFDAVGDVIEAVGDVVESVADVVVDAVEFVGDAVQAVLDDPLPTLLSIAGMAIGIPPYVTSGVITAARGGDLGDIVLSAGTSYLGGQLGAQVAGPVSDSLSSTFIESGVNSTVADIVSDGIGKGLVGGVMAEVKGNDFGDGFAGSFLGTVVGGGVTQLTNIVSDSLLTTATDALNSVGTTANTDFTAGFDSSMDATNITTVGETFTNAATTFDSVDTTGASKR